MKDVRLGDQLWMEWDSADVGNVAYYTSGHVSLDEEIVRRALASTLQRDGIADSLNDGFKLLESCDLTCTYVGFMPEDIEPVVCDEFGGTAMGDLVESFSPVTLVEIFL